MKNKIFCKMAFFCEFIVKYKFSVEINSKCVVVFISVGYDKYLRYLLI